MDGLNFVPSSLWSETATKLLRVLITREENSGTVKFYNNVIHPQTNTKFGYKMAKYQQTTKLFAVGTQFRNSRSNIRIFLLFIEFLIPIMCTFESPALSTSGNI